MDMPANAIVTATIPAAPLPTPPTGPEPVGSLTPVCAPPPASGYEKAAWILLAAGLLFVIHLKLVAALLAGLFVHAVIHGIADRLHGKRLNHERAKVVALAIVSAVLIGLTTAVIMVAIGVMKRKIGNIPGLLDKMAEVVEKAHGWFDGLGLGSMLPESGMDAEQLRHELAMRLRRYAEEHKQTGMEALEMSLHALIGVVIGALASFEVRTPGGPFAAALLERMRRLAAAFETVVFAQIRISALNTLLTALYLEVGLRSFGVHLHFSKTMILLTFLFGLLPVVGNLISNTIIVLISASVSPGVAFSSLIFLILVHKLEYFMNARILGHQIHAAAWELLVAIFAFEAAFGIQGVVLAPIVYAYAKRELLDRRMI